MKLLPYRRFTIDSPLTPGEVAARLRDAIEPPRAFAHSRPERPLVGRLDGTTFDVMRSVTGRNSFRPRVRGRIEPAGSGTRLTGTMQLHEIVMLLMGGLLVLAGSAFLSMAVQNLRNGHLETPTLVALGAVVFFGAISIGGFNSETRPVLDELVRLVDARGGELR
jgi:hypothetical protein